ncbi:MAG: hypothetical protein ACKVS8_12195 [Phycisphaerales bacterium]
MTTPEPANTPHPQPAATPAPAPLDPAVLKSAFNAFKKRWKLTRLDQESRLGGGRPTTGGKPSNIAGIEPPREFPPAVWAELAKQGRIKNQHGGFYGMP